MSQLALLVECFERTKPNLELDPRWKTSPFRDLHSRSPGVSGKWSERAVRLWLQRNGIPAETPFNSTHDAVIGSKLVEIKSVTTADGVARVNQIRDQGYHSVAVLCLMPHEARAWFVDKPSIRQLVKPLHGGRRLDPTAKVGWFLLDALHPPHGWGDGNLGRFLESVRSGCPGSWGLYDGLPDFVESRG